jgi:hypothetical protein
MLRKFFIALTTVMFTSNASFQMAACLLIMFLAYAIHLKCSPYMSPVEYEDELIKLEEKTKTSQYYVKINTILKSIQSQSRKKAVKNIMTRDGRIDKYALVSNVALWVFNFNTVEAVLLFCSVIVSLMGIMYQTQDIYDTTGKDAITSVVITLVGFSIIYLFSVLVAEIWIAFKNSTENKNNKKNLNRMVSRRKNIVPTLEMVTITKSEMNPMLVNKKNVEGDELDKVIQEQTETPPLEIWLAFRDAYINQGKQIKDLNNTISEFKVSKQKEENFNSISYASSSIIKTKRIFPSKQLN